MTSLEHHIASLGLDPCEVMDALQDAGIISDNAIHARDVANTDQWRAIVFINNQPKKPKTPKTK